MEASRAMAIGQQCTSVPNIRDLSEASPSIKAGKTNLGIPTPEDQSRNVTHACMLISV